MDIVKFLTEQLNNPETLKLLGQSVQAKPAQVEKVTQLGIPVLLQAMNQNASTPQGAESLLKALDKHQDDKVDDVHGFLNNLDTGDASKMLQNIFLGKTNSVQNNLAKQTGLQANQVSGLLTQLAPLIMGALAQYNKQQNVAPKDLAGMLSGLTSQTINKSNSGLMGKITDMLDTNNDGNVVDEFGNMLQGFFKKK